VRGVKWFNSRLARPGNARNGKKGWEWDGIRSKAAAGEKKRREERERWHSRGKRPIPLMTSACYLA